MAGTRRRARPGPRASGVPGEPRPGAGADATVALEIEQLAAGGDGVGHLPDGRVVFVPFTAPGDRIRARVVASRRRFARARLEAVESPGPGRVDPPCPVFGRCGGCAWQHVAYPVQCEAKARIVADALSRLAHLPVEGPVELVPSPAPYGHRTRTRVAREGRGIGYRRRGSHAIEPVRACPVLAPALDRALGELAARVAESSADAAEGADEWELALGRDGVRVVAHGPRGAGAGPPLEIDVAGDVLRISPGVFFQASSGLHEALAAAVHDAAGSGRRLLEIHAGAGFFTLGLARRFERVVAVEAHPRALADLRFNLARAGLTHVEIVGRRLEAMLPELPDAEVVVVDPPRTGLPEGAAAALAAAGPERIVYLSCDPATLARDLARLAAGGYAPARVRAFDLFPQTPHVEVLAVLNRLDGPPGGGLVHSGSAPPSDPLGQPRGGSGAPQRER